MDLETKIDLAIHNANISDEVIQCLCEDADYNDAFNQMIKHDEGSFHDLFCDGETYQSIFEHFIKNVKPFRMFYKTELEELVRQEILDNE